MPNTRNRDEKHMPDGQRQRFAPYTLSVHSCTISVFFLTDVVDYYLTFLYRNELMDESELPPVHIKKEPVVNPLLSSPAAAAASGVMGLQMPTSANPLLPSVPLKRTASEAGLNTEPPQMPIIPSGGQLPQTPLAPGAAAAAAASMEPKMKVRDGLGFRTE